MRVMWLSQRYSATRIRCAVTIRDRKNNNARTFTRLFQRSCLFRLDSARLDQENAGYDLQAIGDTVLYFLEQHVLFPQEFLHLLLNGTPDR